MHPANQVLLGSAFLVFSVQRLWAALLLNPIQCANFRSAGFPCVSRATPHPPALAVATD